LQTNHANLFTNKVEKQLSHLLLSQDPHGVSFVGPAALLV